MRQFWLIAAVLGLAAALLAQSSAPSVSKASEDPASAPCTVTGRVVTASDGNPLKSASVMLIPDHKRSENEIYATSSDSDGLFTVKGIPPGRYNFLATHTGFVEQHYKAGVNDTGPVFSLRPGEKVQDAFFRLVAAAVITGRVSNEDGDPMQGVQVIALRRPNEDEIDDLDSPRPRKIEMQPVKTAESDDRGQYRIFGLKPGEYFIKSVDSPPAFGSMDETYWAQRLLGSRYGAVYYPGATQASQAQVVPVKAGEEAQADVTMRRVKTVEIAGRLTGVTSAAGNAYVGLEPADGLTELDLNDKTDQSGNFRFRNIPEGTYYIVAYQKQEGSDYEPRARQKIEVAGENIDGLTIPLSGGVTIQGRVKRDGSSSTVLDQVGLSLQSVEEDGLLGGQSQVKKDGSFEFKWVHDGNYEISFWGVQQDAYVKSMLRGPDDVFEKGVQVEGNALDKIEITLGSDGAKLDGSVSDDDGVVIGARVRLLPDPLTPYNHLRIYRTTTDQLGHFALTNIAPGKYKLTAKPMLSSEKASDKTEPQAITFSANDQKTEDIKLQKPQE
jgi:protocatechuate 3,4-dioxygenase beta subunit